METTVMNWIAKSTMIMLNEIRMPATYGNYRHTYTYTYMYVFVYGIYDGCKKTHAQCLVDVVVCVYMRVYVACFFSAIKMSASLFIYIIVVDVKIAPPASCISVAVEHRNEFYIL